MEDIPPSYDDINVNVLDLLPAYLSTGSLIQLCLVSKTYHAKFVPYLWGSPASHFVPVADNISRTTSGINFANLQVSGEQNDTVYIALTRFKRALRRARLSTRLLCHTLHLPPALSEIYGGPNSTWLREVLDWLPALQSLCVSGLPFFDHESLLAVDQSRNAPAADPNDNSFRTYPVKLLLAAKEPNVTWVGLSLLMPHLPHLVYLDLSYTSSARSVNVLQSLDALTRLQILKLRGIGLRDTELEVLANVIRLRVRLLDIADNQISDMGVRSLLQACVWLPSTHPNGDRSNRCSRNEFESWPVGLPPPPDSLSLDTIRMVELDEALLNQLTHPLTGRLAFEDLPHNGITHLYISGNSGITIESVRSILDIGRLHVLDAGDIGALTAVDLHVITAQHARSDSKETARSRQISTANMNIRGIINRHKSRPSSTYSGDSGNTIEGSDNLEDILRMPGAEKLVPVLHEKASANLTHLRIGHAVATAVFDITGELREKEKKIANVVEFPGELSRASELDSSTREIFEASASSTYATEMPANNQIFEMDATPTPARVELPGDMIHFAISPPVGEMPQLQEPEIISPIRGEGAMAPEVVPVAQPQPSATAQILEDDSPVSAFPSHHSDSTNSTVQNDQRPQTPQIIQTSHPQSMNQSLHPSFSSNKSELARLISLRPKKPITKLHPSFLPNLRTLVLTNIPSKLPTTASSAISNLKSFITACAAETRIAVLKSQTDYSLPPGRARLTSERHAARKLFALRTIVLEINPEPDTPIQRGWRNTGARVDAKSSTGDRDSEAFWAAAENDFSFFNEEGEEAAECGIYDQEPEKYYPTTRFDDEKVFVAKNGYDEPGTPRSPGNATYEVSRGSANNSPLALNSPGGAFGPARNGTVLMSPRNLPLGRNRRTSDDMQREATERRFEMQGTIPRVAPTSNPVQQPQSVQPVMLDVVGELAKWRKERKAAYEKEVERVDGTPGRLADADVYVEGYWSGEVKVVRNAKQIASGKMERQGKVDVFGNYFEGGYLYP